MELLNIHVLVVDDEEDTMFLFKHQFKDWVRDGNIKLSFTLSGEEALIPLDEDKGKDIILILSDINMPSINGFELLRKVKKSYPDIKNNSYNSL